MTTDTTDQEERSGAPRRRRKKNGQRDGGANVIHVAFGDGGGRIDPRALPTTAPLGAGVQGGAAKTAADGSAPTNDREPVTELFTRREVSRLLNVTEARLRTLDKTRIVSPSGSKAGKRAYTFQDLIALRATRELLAHSIKMRDVAKAIGALRQSLPRVTRPLQELRIVSDGRSVVVRSDTGAFEPISGQLVMEFQVKSLREDVVRVLRPETSSARARSAYDLYVHASTLDETPATFAEAEALYTRAIALDPTLAIAYTNLGNIKFRRGDEIGAEALYRRAIEVDTNQPEAHYNLGYVTLERGQPIEAAEFFERALESDPRFADAHFNVAMAYEQMGDPARARPHWERYLELEPTGTWADIARKYL